jgi:hypothetical protein
MVLDYWDRLSQGDLDATEIAMNQLTSITAPAEVIREVLCGAQDHDEHMRGYRWHLYMRDTARRMDAVWAETRKIIAANPQHHADLTLQQWQALRGFPPAERIEALNNMLEDEHAQA